MENNQKKKILILTNSLEGLYKFRWELILALSELKYSIYISSPLDYKIEINQNEAIEYFNLEFNRRGLNPLKDLRQLIEYIKLIKNIKPNIVLTYTVKPNIYGGFASRIMKTPYISNITGLGTSIENKGFLQFIVLRLYKFGLKKSKKIFFQNISNLQFMKKYLIVGDQYKLIPGSGVNTKKFNYLEYPEETNINLIFIGRVMKAKGIDNFLESSKIISQKYKHVKFHIVGSFEEEYKDLIDDFEAKRFIKYHGKVDDIRDYIMMSHAIVHPSFHEGMSNVLLEFASSGRPVIASNIPGCKEVVEENITGYTFEVKNQKSLNETIIKFIELSHESKKQMGIKGRNKVLSEFDRRIIVDRYIETIKENLRE